MTILSNRVSLSTPTRDCSNSTTQTTQVSQPSQSLTSFEFDTTSVNRTRVDNREQGHQDTANTPGTDRAIDLHLGREPCKQPLGNIGPYKAHTVHMQTLGSYAAASGLSRVPILNKEGKIVSSTVPSFPAISVNSLLSVYGATHRIAGLPEHFEQVHRGVLGLLELRELLEFDLGNVGPDCQLNCNVVDFCIYVSKPVSWHTSLIHQIVKMFSDHPSGGFCRIGQVFYCPKFVKLPTMSGHYTPQPNYLNLFNGVNKYISSLMTKSGSRSCFGSVRKHVAISRSGRGWIELAWLGFRPESPASILECTTLTRTYALKRSAKVVKALEGEVRALPGI